MTAAAKLSGPAAVFEACRARPLLGVLTARCARARAPLLARGGRCSLCADCSARGFRSFYSVIPRSECHAVQSAPRLTVGLAAGLLATDEGIVRHPASRWRACARVAPAFFSEARRRRSIPRGAARSPRLSSRRRLRHRAHLARTARIRRDRVLVLGRDRGARPAVDAARFVWPQGSSGSGWPSPAPHSGHGAHGRHQRAASRATAYSTRRSCSPRCSAPSVRRVARRVTAAAPPRARGACSRPQRRGVVHALERPLDNPTEPSRGFGGPLSRPRAQHSALRRASGATPPGAEAARMARSS